MTGTVKARILAAIRAALLDMGGTVVGGLYVPPETRTVGLVVASGASDKEITDTLAEGKYVIEMYTGDDVAADSPAESIEIATFTVGLFVHIPKSVQTTAMEAGDGGLQDLCASINADLYLIYSFSEVAGQWGELARKSDWHMSGDAYASERGAGTAHAFGVTYGFKRGSPTEAC